MTEKKAKPGDDAAAAETPAEDASAAGDTAQTEPPGDAAKTANKWAKARTGSGEAPCGPEAPTSGEDDRVAELEAEVADLKNQLLRAMAETENTRRRLQKERDDAGKYAVAGFAKEILNVADNLSRALEAIPEDALEDDEALKALADGVKLTGDDLLAMMERHGIRKIDPLGEKFDHNLHQAMMQVEGSGRPAGTVAQVLAPGYTIHDRLLRPAMVGVAAGDTEGQGEPGQTVDTTA